MSAVARNLVNLKAVDKGYGSRSVLRDITLGVAAGDRIGVVGAQRRRQVDAAAADRRRRGARRGRASRARATWTSRCSARATSSTSAARSARSSSAAAPTTSGPATRASAPCSTGCSAASASRASRTGSTRRSRRCPAASGAGSRSRKLLLDGPELLLLDEPTNHLDVEGVDWLARHLAARRGSLLVVTHDRWFLDAVCTTTWEVADGAVHQYEGGYAAYVLARAERDRQEAARDDRRRQLVRKELAWLRRGPPARTTQAEVPHRGRQRADRRRARAARPRRAAALRLRAARRQGARRRGRLRRVRRPAGAARRDLAPRARATASRSSASTARARRRSSRCSAASSSRRPGAVERGATVRLALPLAGHRRDPGRPARARVARGGARARATLERRRRDHRGPALRPLRLPRRRARARSCATSPAASAGGCSSCGC